jgi:hypothetical protein
METLFWKFLKIKMKFFDFPHYWAETKVGSRRISKRVLVGLILNQEDGKDSNFILKPINALSRAGALLTGTATESGESSFELVSVDNDRSFYPSLLKNGAGEIFPQVKDISFLFEIEPSSHLPNHSQPLTSSQTLSALPGTFHLTG